jgi:hypothetical protein
MHALLGAQAGKTSNRRKAPRRESCLCMTDSGGPYTRVGKHRIRALHIQYTAHGMNFEEMKVDECIH